MPAGELDGKVAIVTGGTGNLGSVCARRLAEEGAAVLVSDLPGPPVEELVNHIVDSGGNAVAHQGDIFREEDVVSMTGTSVSNSADWTRSSTWLPP